MGKHKKTERKLYKRNRKFVLKNESKPKGMDILKDITNKSSIDPINKVNAWMKENEVRLEKGLDSCKAISFEKSVGFRIKFKIKSVRIFG